MSIIIYYLLRHDLACAEDLLVWDSRAQSIRHVNETLLQRVGGHHAGTPIQEGKGGCKEGTSLMERFYRGYFAINQTQICLKADNDGFIEILVQISTEQRNLPDF